MEKFVSGASSCINHEFSQVKLLRTALTHSSYANERETEEHNERLEFLGDAVLELVISEEAFSRYPDVPEGQLTRVRSALVKEATLAAVACELGLDEHVLLGRGEEAQGGRKREALLADALEAVFGAVFLDAGYAAASSVILAAFEGRWPENPDGRLAKDYKSRLQEATQERYKARPTYALAGQSGPEHEKVFSVTLELPDGRTFTAEGGSVKKAEQEAAKAALEALSGLSRHP
jgi:ribonuclease-3